MNITAVEGKLWILHALVSVGASLLQSVQYTKQDWGDFYIKEWREVLPCSLVFEDGEGVVCLALQFIRFYFRFC